MIQAVDLDAYCRRIGHDGPRTPTLETLRALHGLHPAAVPFENLDPRFGVTPSLDLAALQAKLVRSRRGGYCFEQNTLFGGVLEAMGFSVQSLIARVRWRQPADAPRTARSHKLLRVEIEGRPWLADVGFGGCLLTAPLRLVTGEVQQTPHGPARLVQLDGGEIEQQFLFGDDWTPTYRFTLDPAPHIDFEVANWFVATHPTSIFTGILMVERAVPGRRLSLTNGDLTIREPDGAVRRRSLATGAELDRVLREDFGLEPPPHADLDAVVARTA